MVACVAQHVLKMHGRAALEWHNMWACGPMMTTGRGGYARVSDKSERGDAGGEHVGQRGQCLGCPLLSLMTR